MKKEAFSPWSKNISLVSLPMTLVLICLNSLRMSINSSSLLVFVLMPG